MPNQTPVLLPAPRRLAWGPDTLAISGDLVIAVTAGQQQLLPALLRLKKFVSEQLGIALTISASAAGLEGQVHVRLDAACPAIAHPQGYTLTVGDGRIALNAATPEGAAYGLATLKQLLAGCGRQLQEVAIEDWPDFARRGAMLDISRGKVPTMDSLYRFVDLLADLKLNEFQLYTEHTFAYRDHREVWQDYSPITGEEILALDRYCRERFIDLVPNQNSFGHLTPWLVRDRYKHLAEAPDGFDFPWGDHSNVPFSLCPLEPGTIPFLGALYDELLPHFTSPYCNVGCDETFDLGQGRSAQAVAERGEHRVYLDQLLKVYQLVRERGRQMMFWGDIIMRAPEYVAELPKDVIALEWGYEADHPFDEHGAEYAKAGIPFYVCGGTSTWNSLVGRTDNALGNLRNAAENGRKHGAVGYLVTIWGDRGHQDYTPVSYLPLAYGAGVSWALDANREADVRAFLNRLVFGDRSEWIGQVLHQLGNTYQAGGLIPFNNTALGLALHYGPRWQIENSPLSDFDAAAAEAAILEAAAGLDEVELTCPDGALVVRELRNSVRLLLHLCGYIRFKQGERSRSTALSHDLAEIMAEHRELWLARNRIGGLEEMSMQPFRAILAEYRAV